MTATLPPPAYHATARVHFPDWGNTWDSGGLGDCAQAAIANAETVISGHVPGWSWFVGFYNATQGEYMQDIVNGYSGQPDPPLPTAEVELKAEIVEHHALVAQVWWNDNTPAGENLTPRTMHNNHTATHAVVIDGYGPRGLKVVTYGQTVNMSWPAFFANEIEVYALNG